MTSHDMYACKTVAFNTEVDSLRLDCDVYNSNWLGQHLLFPAHIPFNYCTGNYYYIMLLGKKRVYKMFPCCSSIISEWLTALAVLYYSTPIFKVILLLISYRVLCCHYKKLILKDPLQLVCS